MKIAVVGSRNVDRSAFDMILGQLPAGCSEIISGGARGVDFYAKMAAKQLQVKYTCCHPNYKKYGRTAPLLRNVQIVDKADCVLAFWDGHSRGTMHALIYCIKCRKPFKIYLFNKNNVLYKT